jgi:putative ABC transport system permease protein
MSSGIENAMKGWDQDLRYAVRMLRRNPGFTVICALTLALGIGGCTAIFSAVNPILFAPLPYPNPTQIVALWDVDTDGSHLDGTFGTYREILARSRAFDSLAVIKPWQPTMTGAAQPERFEGELVSASYFHLFGVPPIFGRDFDPGDDRLNGSKVVILSNALWQQRFSADRTIVGRRITLEDETYTVVGVMPSSFQNVLAPPTQLWSLLQYDMSQGNAWGHHLRMVGRLRPGVQVEQARQELNTIAHNPVQDFPRQPWAALNQGLVVNSLQHDITESVRPALLLIFGGVGVVLLIACVNVTSLLIARIAQRRGEFAMRAALGAVRIRLIRQMLSESLLLAFIGGVLGVVLAKVGLLVLAVLSQTYLAEPAVFPMDWAVFLFALAVTTLAGLAVGLIPAIQLSQPDLRTALQNNTRSSVGGHQMTRRTLVVAEVALALILLVSAGLLLRSVGRILAVAPGFDPTHAVTMQVQTFGHRLTEDSAIHRFFEQSLDAVSKVPGISNAAFTSQLPLSGDLDQYGVHFELDNNGDEQHSAFRYAVTAGYFKTMGIPLRRGRLIEEHDAAGTPPVAVINESFAKRKFGDRDPVGERVHVGPENVPWFTIVGVVGDVKQESLAVTTEDEIYVPTTQWPSADNVLWLVVQTHGDAAPLIPFIKSAVWSVDKDQPIVRVGMLDEIVASSTAQRRSALILFEMFGLVALVLAASGIYGVLSGSVTERTREIGVRSALGASPTDILVLIVRQGMILTGIGIVVGLTASVLGSNAFASLLFGISKLDPMAYGPGILLLTTVSMLACLVPAWRAARIDPSIALRAE